MPTPHLLRHIVILFTLVLPSFSATGQIQQSPVTDEETQVMDTGAISGSVVNENGQPLPNALVFIRALGSLKQVRSVTTDREGRFRLSGLERLTYSISASVPAYAAPVRDPDSIEAAYYRVGDSVRLVLVKGGVITGSVKSTGDEVVVGVSVKAQMIRDGNGQPLRYRAMFQDSITDDRGIYRIYGLPTGTYVVMAGGTGSFWGPVVNAYATDSPTYAPASTRETAAEINVRAGEETANVDIRYRGERGHIVGGVASGPPSPEPVAFNLTLTSTLDGGSLWNNVAYQPRHSRGFVFFGVADGDYDVTAQSPMPNGEWTLSEPRRIRVSGADVTGIELITKPLGVISGRVLLEDSKAAECKNKRRPLFAETLVFAWRNENKEAKAPPQFNWPLGAPVSPDKQGNISLRNLAAGQYHFITRFSAKYWYLQSVSLPTSQAPGPKATPASREVDAARNWTTVNTGDRLSGLTIKLSEGAASLHGKLVLREGEKPPARLHVYLLPAEQEKADDVLRFFASPIIDGAFAVNNLAPGRYWIVAQPALDVAMSSLAKLRLPDQAEIRAKLRSDAEDSKTEIEFKPCQNVMDYELTLKSNSLPTKEN